MIETMQIRVATNGGFILEYFQPSEDSTKETSAIDDYSAHLVEVFMSTEELTNRIKELI